MMHDRLATLTGSDGPSAGQSGQKQLHSFNDELSLSPDQICERTRGQALLRTSLPDIQSLTADEVVSIQTILQHGDTFGFWSTPTEWSPCAPAAVARIDMRHRITHYLPEPQQRLIKSIQESLVACSVDGKIDNEPAQANLKVRVEQIMDGAVLTLSRLLILMRIGPVGLGRKGRKRPLKPSNIAHCGYGYLPRLVALGTAKWLALCEKENEAANTEPYALPLEIGYLSTIERKDLDHLRREARRFVNLEIQRIFEASHKGYWRDVPFVADNSSSVTVVAGPPIQNDKPTARRPHLPLPDEYVSQMGNASMWLIHDFAPNLFIVVKGVSDIFETTKNDSLPDSDLKRTRDKLIEDYLSSYEWKDSSGQAIVSPPIVLRLAYTQSRSTGLSAPLKSDGSMEEEEEEEEENAENVSIEHLDWPPRKFHHVKGLMYSVQLAHLFVVTMSLAGRKTELVTLPRTCVEYSRNGMPYASGRHYKLVQRVDGELRDWVLPDLAVLAIEQQVRLIELSDCIADFETSTSEGESESPASRNGATHLWFRSGIGGGEAASRTLPLLRLTEALVSYATTLGMSTNPGGQNLRLHRIRKTIARIVALALTQAPKILMDVFGHKSIEMTLDYVLSDKNLQLEIETVSRELRIMRATEVVEAMVAAEESAEETLALGGFGGPAALMIRRAIDTQKGRTHRQGKEWGAKNAIELAEILTLQGKFWSLVRPGVICTKFAGTESGPCNKSLGRPEPSKCQSHCKHRLEESFLREDVDGAIHECVKAYLETGTSGDKLTQSFWAGQLRAHIVRFDDLRVKWMSNPTVAEIMRSSTVDGEAT
jgi:hypothetical protein